MTYEQVKAWVESCIDCEQETVLLADGFEDAFLGLGEQFGQPSVAVYDIALCAEILVKRDGMSLVEAYEYLYYNTLGAFISPGPMPIFLTRIDI